jgi:hypothetical protein
LARHALSEMVFSEVAEVLSKPKFARILTEDWRREALELLAAAALQKVEDCWEEGQLLSGAGACGPGRRYCVRG